jgi:AcrR family transcriptional regulator
MSTQASKAPGRPRSIKARDAILSAAYDLVIERGYAAVTTADIAVRAGAGKQTIYRWWPTKAALVLDALDRWGRDRIDIELAQASGLAAFLGGVCAGATRAGPVLRSLMAEAQFDPALRADLRTRLVEQRRTALRRALADHGIADDRRREALILAIYGALWYRLLLDEPLDAAFTAAMVALADCAR